MEQFEQKSRRTRTALGATVAAALVVTVGLAVALPLVLRSSSRIDPGLRGPSGDPSDTAAPGQIPGGESVAVQVPFTIPGQSDPGTPPDLSAGMLSDNSPVPSPGPAVDPFTRQGPDGTRNDQTPSAGPVDPRIPTDLGFEIPDGVLDSVIDDPDGNGRARSWRFTLAFPGSCTGLEDALAAGGVTIGKVSCFTDAASVDGLYRDLFVTAHLLDPTTIGVTLWF